MHLRVGAAPRLPALDTATVIERMAKAGAYTFGGLNMAEFAQNPTGHNKTFGDCHNPLEPALCHRRVVVGFGGLGRRAVQLHGAGV